MPNVWTHMIFATKLADKVGYRIEPQNKPYLNYGAQGPDPYFYHRFWPWLKDKPVTKIGERIHYESCGPYLLDMIAYAQKQADIPLRAYVFGFVTHHILDRNTHPYIIFRSGNENNRHQKLEIIIDTLLLKEWYGVDAWKAPVYKELYVGKQLDEPIKELLAQLNMKYFPETVEQLPLHYIDESYTDMIKAWKVLNDPYGWKNRLLKERISPFSHHQHFEARDYLNREKQAWSHPTDQNERYTHSFDELFSQAEHEGEEILSHLIRYWEQPDTESYERLKHLIGNRSYDTGKDCTLDLENRYFDPIIS